MPTSKPWWPTMSSAVRGSKSKAKSAPKGDKWSASGVLPPKLSPKEKVKMAQSKIKSAQAKAKSKSQPGPNPGPGPVQGPNPPQAIGQEPTRAKWMRYRAQEKIKQAKAKRK